MEQKRVHVYRLGYKIEDRISGMPYKKKFNKKPVLEHLVGDMINITHSSHNNFWPDGAKRHEGFCVHKKEGEIFNDNIWFAVDNETAEATFREKAIEILYNAKMKELDKAKEKVATIEEEMRVIRRNMFFDNAP